MKLRSLLAATALLLAGGTQAATVSLIPSTSSAVAGTQFTVDVVFAGLNSGQAVGGFDLDVVFDISVLSAASVTFGSALGLDGVDQFSSSIISSGRIDFASVSLLLPADLKALQLGAFSIAQLTFDALAPGATGIQFDALTAPGLLFSDDLGNALTVTVGTEGSVTVTPSAGTVPTPGSLPLILLALGLLPAIRRVRSAALRAGLLQT